MSLSPKISIIVPTLNEAAHIGGLLRYLRWAAEADRCAVELIVADGGSHDATCDAARVAGADRLVVAPPGRARQMNAGAAVATGRVLYFLHADAHPDTDFLPRIVAAIADGYGCGCLRLRFADPPPVLRLHAWLVRMRWRMVRFGDQSLFVLREQFLRCGGFRESLLLFEDQEIVSRLRRYCRFAVLRSRITASDRAFRHSGVLRTHIGYYLLQLAFAVGVSQPALAAMRAYLLRRPQR